ncbi:MAG: hypothetical protein M3R64_11155 [Pseudomonadota bacterium]|nr:hypothetical protein [Pseudomonadota bacterium]
MSAKLKAIHTHALDFWFARTSVVVVAALQMLIINRLTLGPQWLGPALEISLLAPLSMATAWTQGQAREATEEQHWRRVAKWRLAIRRLAVALTALVSIMNFAALVMLVKALLSGHAGASGQTLLLDAVNIWATNVIAFALWFWSIDRGGPAARGLSKKEVDDFLFPQMTLGTRSADWSPGFADYLYVSYTNATAFSPTDTMPMTGRAKLLMMAESAISLLTIALVAARAVNILA